MSYNNRTEFDILLKAYGGRLEVERFDDDYPLRYVYLYSHQRIREFLKSIEHYESFSPIKEKLLFDFIFDPTCNGLADKINDKYVFGVNFGFVDTILYATNTLFSHNKFFPGLGNAHIEDDISKSIDRDGFDILKRKKDEEEDISFFFEGYKVPKDVDRRVYANIVAELATTFVFLHEFSHIACGHIDYKGQNDEPTAFKENGIFFNQDYTFEFEADINAIRMLSLGGVMYSGYFDRKSNENDGDSKNDAYQGIGETEHYRRLSQYLTPIAVTLTMLIFAQYSKRYKDWDAKKHPHPLCRLTAMNLGVNNYGDVESIKEIDDIFVSNWFRGYRHTLVIWEDLKLPGYEMLNDLDEEEWKRITQSVHSMMEWIQFDEKSPAKGLSKVSMRNLGNEIVNNYHKQ